MPQTPDDHVHTCIHSQVSVQVQLPAAALAKLQLLHLRKCALEFSTSNSSRSSGSNSSGGQDGPAIVLPALRSIHLQNCRDPLGTMLQLGCPKLTKLHLSFSDDSPSPPADSQQQTASPDAALSALLQQLPELLWLTLANTEVTDAGLAQLSCLQKLQHCALACELATLGVLANISSSLTSLALINGDGVLQERILPVAGWPHLCFATVTNTTVQPAFLSRLTALARLHLDDCWLAAHPDRVSGSRVER